MFTCASDAGSFLRAGICSRAQNCHTHALAASASRKNSLRFGCAPGAHALYRVARRVLTHSRPDDEQRDGTTIQTQYRFARLVYLLESTLEPTIASSVRSDAARWVTRGQRRCRASMRPC